MQFFQQTHTKMQCTKWTVFIHIHMSQSHSAAHWENTYTSLVSFADYITSWWITSMRWMLSHTTSYSNIEVGENIYGFFSLENVSSLLLCCNFVSSYVCVVPPLYTALVQIICQANIDICQPTGVWILTTFRQDECLNTFTYGGL